DQADAGAKTYAREHELALAYNSQDLLAQIERAVQRMDAGTYGICESCAKPIGNARMQVFPRATLCVTCTPREARRRPVTRAQRARPGRPRDLLGRAASACWSPWPWPRSPPTS